MKKLLLLLLCVPFIGLGQSDAFFYNEFAKYDAKCTSKGGFVNDKKDGVWKIYYNDVKLICEINYQNGEINGFVKIYDYSKDDYNKTTEFRYVSELYYFEKDSPIWYKSFDENKNILRDETFENGEELN